MGFVNLELLLVLRQISGGLLIYKYKILTNFLKKFTKDKSNSKYESVFLSLVNFFLIFLL